jgi:hypothetical protein
LKDNPFGVAWNVGWCIYGFATACSPSNNNQQSRDALHDAAQYLATESAYAIDVYLYLQYPFGNNTDWLQSDALSVVTNAANYNNFLQTFTSYASADSDDGEYIDDSERTQLLSMPLYMSSADVDLFIARWNRTVEYWNSNIFNLTDVPDGQSTDFMEKGVFAELQANAFAAQEEAVREGYASWADAYNYAVETFNQVRLKSSR